MAKKLLQSAENLEAVDVLSEKKLQKNLELLTMIKISLVRLQKSLVYHQNIFRKAQSYLPKKDYLPMHLPDVILQENPLRIWYMRHRERLYWNWQKKSPV